MKNRVNDVGDDWFYDDHDPDPHYCSNQDPNEIDFHQFDESEYEEGMLESEWIEKLQQMHDEAEEARLEEEEDERRSEAAKRAAETRKKNKWAKEDEERRMRKHRKFRSIDDPWKKS